MLLIQQTVMGGTTVTAHAQTFEINMYNVNALDWNVNVPMDENVLVIQKALIFSECHVSYCQ